jgi:hypothetical protein
VNNVRRFLTEGLLVASSTSKKKSHPSLKSDRFSKSRLSDRQHSSEHFSLGNKVFQNLGQKDILFVRQPLLFMWTPITFTTATTNKIFHPLRAQLAAGEIASKDRRKEFCGR